MDDELQASTEISNEWEFPSGKELGTRLKARRKEMGLTHAQVSEQIRVGAQHLNALENEEWDHLPSPAFVKGFIRSYARLLGLSEEGLIALYEESSPRPQAMPKPLQTVSEKKRGGLYLVLVLVVLAGGFAAYEWIGYPFLKEKITQKDSGVPVEDRLDDGPAIPDRPPDREETPSHQVEPPAVSPEIAQEPLHESSVVSPGLEGVGSSAEKAADVPQQAEGPASSEPASASGPEPPVTDSEPASEGAMPPLVLKASVKEKVWVRVVIDGETTRESTFDRGSSHEWRAHKSFELLIGNAGGLDLEFNGKKVENVGKRGQVIRLRLPSKDEMSVTGE